MSSYEVGDPGLLDGENTLRKTSTTDSSRRTRRLDGRRRQRGRMTTPRCQRPATQIFTAQRPTARVVSPLASATRSSLRVMPTSPDSYAALYLREVGEIVRTSNRPPSTSSRTRSRTSVGVRAGSSSSVVGGGCSTCVACGQRLPEICDFEGYTPTTMSPKVTARTNDEGWETSFDAGSVRRVFLRGTRFSSSRWAVAAGRTTSR